jgi:streptogramin lyase
MWGAGARRLAVGEGSVWVRNDEGDAVTQIDPRRGKVVGRPIRVGSAGELPSGIAVGEGAVWVANYGPPT